MRKRIMANFIKCTDPETIKLLKKEGFKLISESNGVATFLNDSAKKINFDKTKIAYSNILPMS